MTSSELIVVEEKTDAETQSVIRFLLLKIKNKDHNALIKFLEDEGSINQLKIPFEKYKKQDVRSLALLMTESARTISIVTLIALLVIVQSVSEGQPLRLSFDDVETCYPLIESHHEIKNNDGEWFANRIEGITDTRVDLKISEWAEIKRYLPPQVTLMPGFYDFNVAPYLKEIVDCISVTSSIKELDFMKGAQIGATTGVLENIIGYVIEHVKAAPVMLLTADDGLAKLRIDSYIIPMLLHSKLYHLIRSADINNTRKTGNTRKKIEWVGGGFLIPYGAQNADKLRSVSIRYLLEDECDTYPERVGKDGDPQALAEARTHGSFYGGRKIVRISTPLIKGKSRIAQGFKNGDQRKYFVPCKGCGLKQVLKFQGVNKITGQVFGLIWEMEGDMLVKKSVKYVCCYCGFEHVNADKACMLTQGEWRPTAQSKDEEHRSYHISALYAPVGWFTWVAVVKSWLKAWDVESSTVKNVELLQEFYNNVLGLPFEIRGSQVRFTQVSAHRRPIYRLGTIPNQYALRYSGSPILLITCQVDVHKKNLAVSVMGWTRDACCYVIDYWRFEVVDDEDDCTELTSPVWGQLRELIEDKQYLADDNKTYKIVITLIDAGYSYDTVCVFCSDYSSGVYPILGRERPAKNQAVKEFADFQTQIGTIGYRILVDHYKDRIAPVLRREWTEELGLQKRYHFNAPVDISDKQLKELTVETRREKVDENGFTTYFWHRPGNARNELWDLLVYGHSAVEILAWCICIQHFELQTIDWPQFWDYIEGEAFYFNQKVATV